VADDDGTPSYAEVLDALRGGNVTESAPDPSAPVPPSVRDAFAALTPPGTDPDALMASLKAAQASSVPLSRLAKASQAAAGMRWCRSCQRPEPAGSACPVPFASTGHECAMCGSRMLRWVGGPHGPLTVCASCGSNEFFPVAPADSAAPPGDPAGQPDLPLPADPFAGGGALAAIAAKDMLEDMLAAGIPAASAENILGCMLAAMVRDAPAPEAS